MEEFKNFDENIKNKLSEEEFPFDESNWEKAAKMIDDSRQPKKRYGWIVIASLVFVGTSVLLFNTFKKDDGKSSGKEIALSSGEKTQGTKETKRIEGTEEIQGSGNKNQDSKTQDGNVKTEGTKEIQGSGNKNQDSKTQDENVKTEEMKGAEEMKEIQESGTKNQDNGTREERSKTQEIKATEEILGTHEEKVKTLGTKGIEGTKETSKVMQSENSIPKKEKKNKSIKAESTNAVALNNIKETKTTEVKVSSGIEKKKMESKTPEEKQITSTKNKETTKQPNNTEKENQLAGTTNTSVTVTINSKSDSTAKPIEKIVASAPSDSVRKTDSVKTVVETKTEPKIEETKPESFDKNIISVEAGATYLLGWQTPVTKEGNGFNPVFGVNYSHFFTKNIGVMIGLQYNSVSNFVNNTLTKDSMNNLITGGSVSSVTHYDFGVQNDVTIINTTKLHYLVAPIKFQFQVKKNIFGVGCNFAYVVNSDNTVETYTERNSAVTQYKVTKTTGYYLGSHNSLDIQLGAFYRRKIHKGLSVNAEFLYGLSDVKNNSFFKSNVTEKNIGFKLTLCYDLFKK